MESGNYRRNSSSGFTIVELLVVIVVIGILATITIVTYTGISQKAVVASLQSDLSSAARQFKLYNVEYGSYPNGDKSAAFVNNCPKKPSPSVDVDTRYCLKLSGGNIIDSYTGTATSFMLVIYNGTNFYSISESSNPAIVTTITAIGDITGSTSLIGSVLTAGVLTPDIATASYQWQSSTTVVGTYTNISGATSNTYTLTLSDVSNYLKVVATGTGGYTGSQTSNATAQITDPNWLTIDTQTWAKANLNVGDMLPNGSTNPTDNGVVQKWCYSNIPANCTTYGGLYQWSEAMGYVTTQGVKGICPDGAHIPSDNDLKILEIKLGLTPLEAEATGYRGTNQGTQLKIGGSSGLDIPLGGIRGTDGSFSSLPSFGYLWSSTESGIYAWAHYVYSANSMVGRGSSADKLRGHPVRCLKD
jgi:uncharacterized protein (TIGR02145 family)/prepilin-type N-terminal cleavage/methylation domain-containing protein